MLKIDISGRHMEVTEAMHNYTIEKLGTIDKYLDLTTRLEVVFLSNSSVHHVEVIAHLDNYPNVIIKKEEADCYACIDKVHDVLEHKLSQLKDKIKDKRKRSSVRFNAMEGELSAE